jgi:hypothetical protein
MSFAQMSLRANVTQPLWQIPQSLFEYFWTINCYDLIVIHVVIVEVVHAQIQKIWSKIQNENWADVVQTLFMHYYDSGGFLDHLGVDLLKLFSNRLWTQRLVPTLNYLWNGNKIEQNEFGLYLCSRNLHGIRSQCYKTFSVRNLRIFVPSKFFKPSLMFVGKASSPP